MQVWRSAVGTAHAVEPSLAMRWLGIQIEEFWRSSHSRTASPSTPGGSRDKGNLQPPAEAEGHFVSSQPSEAACTSADRSIRWLQHLEGYRDRKGLASQSKRRTTWVQSTGMSRGTASKSGPEGPCKDRQQPSKLAGGRKYDLVVASYSLGELQSPADQRRALKALWDATADVLVLVEPGTPSGSALVRAARATVRAFILSRHDRFAGLQAVGTATSSPLRRRC